MHSKPTRIETPYPLSPERFVNTIADVAAGLPKLYRATVCRGTTYDTWICEAERKRLGNVFWSRRIRQLDVVIVPNTAGVAGGVRAWNLENYFRA